MAASDNDKVDVAQPVASAIKIDQIRLDGLFGLYSYTLPPDKNALTRSAILYGENGVGKTNVLQIVYHLLSPGESAGHRTALSKIKFRRAEVALSNGILVIASRERISTGPLRVEVRRSQGTGETKLGGWNWFPPGEPGRDHPRWLMNVDPRSIKSTRAKSAKQRTRAVEDFFVKYIEAESDPLEGEEAFLRALSTHVPPIYMLSADRILSSDRLSKEPTFSYTPSSPADLRPQAMLAKGRESALREAISAASRRLSQLAVGATRQGYRSMHTIYQDLIKRLGSQHAVAEKTSIGSLTAQLLQLSSRYDQYSKYGLAPQLRGEALVERLRGVSGTETAVAVGILKPYVESLVEQANSLDRAYEAIDTLVSTLNNFLYDKKLGFNLGDGLVVMTRTGETLNPSDLSSGEQQLLLLFCQVVKAQSDGGIFIVDEPEISLNIKWQRTLLDSLMKLDGREQLQFILASHSMEVISRHRDDVVVLRDSGDGK